MNGNRLKILERVFLLCGACIVALAAALFVSQHHVQAQLHEQISAAISYVDTKDKGDWSPKRVAAFDKAVATADRPAIAKLDIASLNLSVAVVDGTDDWALNVGIGRVAGTAAIEGRGNLALAGHRDGFFRKLKDIQERDEITLQTPGRMRTYRVASVAIVEPDNVEVLRATKNVQLTLITCFPFYFVGDAPERFVVQATLIEDALIS